MFEGRIIIFSAPSGAGKTTIVRALLEKHPELFSFSVSATTRMRRPHEIEGVHYYFLSTEDFKQKIENDAFVEYEQVYSGLYYGTLKSEIERIWANKRHVLLDVDVRGGCNLKEKFKEKALSIFVMPPSLEILRKRLIDRGTESAQSLEMRIAKAASEIEFSTRFDRIVVNDDLQKAIKQSMDYVELFLKKSK
ncbi:MAG: guanylate kinase [Flammeovirgaceae bacterium]